MRTGRAPFAAFVVVALICCTCGGGVLLIPGVALVRLARTLAWQPVLASVEDVSLRQDADGVMDVRAEYRYSWGGREYRSSQVDFLSPSSEEGHRRRFEQLEASHGNGKPVTAWLNPRDPAEAVLFRDFDSGLWFLVLFGLMFALPGAGFGVYGLAGLLRGQGPGAVVAQGAHLPRVAAEAQQGGFVLVDTEDTWRGHGLLAVIALFWNGLTWTFVAIFGLVIARGEASTGMTVFFVLFMTPFVLIGLFLAYKWVEAVRRTLRMPAGRLWLSRWPLRPGDRVEARFERRLRGARGDEPLDAFGGSLRLTEKVRYRVGTDTRTAEETAREVVLDLGAPALDAQGIRVRFAVSVPSDAPPSFEASDNEIVWNVRLVMKPRGFPEDDSVFELLVVPPGLS